MVVRWKGGVEFREIGCMGALLLAKTSLNYHKRNLLPLGTAKLSSRKIVPAQMPSWCRDEEPFPCCRPAMC